MILFYHHGKYFARLLCMCYANKFEEYSLVISKKDIKKSGKMGKCGIIEMEYFNLMLFVNPGV